MSDYFEWLWSGEWLSYQSLAVVQCTAIGSLLFGLVFVPDGPATRNKRLFPLRFARYLLAITSLILLSDLYTDYYARQTSWLLFVCAVIYMLWANRWAANVMIRHYEGEAELVRRHD